MDTMLQDTTEYFSKPLFSSLFRELSRGIEKESFRVNYDSSPALTPHPDSLGASLTHKFITTDYGEAQMEFITPVCNSPEEVLGVMNDIHRHVYHNLEKELLWSASMPCTIEDEHDVQLARYGSSESGRKKNVYRQGLASRYGSIMQSISGIHYNFSMPSEFWPHWQEYKGNNQHLQDFISESYFDLIRNFIRLGWLLPYLFGASPAVDSTFVKHSRTTSPLHPLGSRSHYLPYATSLRLSDIGYSSKEQDSIDIDFNGLYGFVNSLQTAIHQGGLREESELYGSIRPKQVVKGNESLTDALFARGVEYVEIRSLDINPFLAAGLDLDEIHFLDTFLIYCLLKDSPELTHKQRITAGENLELVATKGRDTSIELMDNDSPRQLMRWGWEIFIDLQEVALLLDKANGSTKYLQSMIKQKQKLICPERTPSAKILEEMKTQNLEVNDLALHLSKIHRKTFLDSVYEQMREEEFNEETRASIERLRKLEKENLTLTSSDNQATDNNKEGEEFSPLELHSFLFGNEAPA